MRRPGAPRAPCTSAEASIAIQLIVPNQQLQLIAMPVSVATTFFCGATLPSENNGVQFHQDHYSGHNEACKALLNRAIIAIILRRRERAHVPK